MASVMRLFRLRSLYSVKVEKILRCTFTSDCRNNETISAQKKTDLKYEIQNFVANSIKDSYDLYAARATVDELYFNREVAPTRKLGEPFSSDSIWKFILAETQAGENIYINSEMVFAEGYNALEQYIHLDEVSENHKGAFTALERFYNNKGFNEESLSSLADMESETNVTSLLTNHLLSQLIHRPANYIIDSRYTRKPYGGCPCGCRKQIQFGTTNIGSQLFFYGRADVILFPSSSDIFNAETNSSPAVFQLEHGKHMIKPGIKRLDKNWKLEENLEEDDICSGESKHDAFDAKTINQVCKQAISLSLWKHRRLLYNNIKNNNGDTVSMIPVCALNKEKCFVTMYNVQSDYLLIMKEINFLDIFKGGNLQFSTIINLWLLIHHSLFCTPPDEDAKEKLAGTCNLIRHLGKESFESIVKTSKFAYDIQPDVPKDKHTQIRKIHAGKKRPKLFPED